MNERAIITEVLLQWAGRDGSLDTETERQAAAEDMAGEVLARLPLEHADLVVCFSREQAPEVGPVLDHEGCYGPHYAVGPAVP